MFLSKGLLARVKTLFDKESYQVVLYGESAAQPIAWLGKYKTGRNDYYWDEFKYSKIFKTQKAAEKALNTMISPISS